MNMIYDYDRLIMIDGYDRLIMIDGFGKDNDYSP